MSSEPNYGPLEHWMGMVDYVRLRAPMPHRWKTKTGRILHMSTMSDEHIRNCIRMMERNGQGDHMKCNELRVELEEREEYGRHVSPEEAKILQEIRMKEKKKLRGFAAMDPEKRREVARLGGISAHRKGTAHRWNTESAIKAGRKGGFASRGGRGKLKTGE